MAYFTKQDVLGAGQSLIGTLSQIQATLEKQKKQDIINSALIKVTTGNPTEQDFRNSIADLIRAGADKDVLKTVMGQQRFDRQNEAHLAGNKIYADVLQKSPDVPDHIKNVFKDVDVTNPYLDLPGMYKSIAGFVNPKAVAPKISQQYQKWTGYNSEGKFGTFVRQYDRYNPAQYKDEFYEGFDPKTKAEMEQVRYNHNTVSGGTTNVSVFNGLVDAKDANGKDIKVYVKGGNAYYNGKSIPVDQFESQTGVKIIDKTGTNSEPNASQLFEQSQKLLNNVASRLAGAFDQTDMLLYTEAERKSMALTDLQKNGKNSRFWPRLTPSEQQLAEQYFSF